MEMTGATRTPAHAALMRSVPKRQPRLAVFHRGRSTSAAEVGEATVGVEAEGEVAASSEDGAAAVAGADMAPSFMIVQAEAEKGERFVEEVARVDVVYGSDI